MGEIRLDYCCRLCLKEGFSLTNIFSHRSAAGDPLYQILNFIYELKIFENDGLPSQICSPCMWRMIEFDAYKRNVRSSEAEIMRLLNQTRTFPDEAKNNSFVTKTEDNEMVGASDTDRDTLHLEDGAEASVIVGHGKINIKEEIEIVEWEMPEEMKRGAMDIEGQGNRNTINIDIRSCSSKVILRGKDLELKESELFMDKVDATQSTGSSDMKKLITLEVSEESVGNSFEGESIFSTQGIADKNRDKGMPENDLRGDVVSEEESLSAELSKRILDDSKSEVFPLKPPLSKRKSGFICDICKKKYASKKNLGNHLWVHYDDRPFSCNICNKTYKQDTGRYNHELTHLRDNISFGNSEEESKKNPYSCGVCTKNFSTKNGLYSHSNLHSEKYKCNSCGKSFHSNGNLKRHLRLHTKAEPLKCKVCFKCFIDKSNLNCHLLIHSSERPFSCEICDKKFKRNSHKLQHELQHLRKNNIPNC